MKLVDGDKKGLAEISRTFVESDEPAGTIMNFLPLGDVACDEDTDKGTLTCFGVFGFGSAFTELKLSSLGPYLGKL